MRFKELDFLSEESPRGLSYVATTIDELFREKVSYERYQKNPVAFLKEQCGVRVVTKQMKQVASEVVKTRKVIVKSANAVGKTFLAARLAAWFFRAYADAKVWTAAAPPEDNLDLLLWGEINHLFDEKPGLFAGCTHPSRMIRNMEPGPKNFITGQAIPKAGSAQQRKSAWSGKHAPAQLFILDEGDGIPDEVYEAIDTCMSGGYIQRLLVLFNPREATGILRDWERSGEAKVLTLDAFHHPNVVTGEDIVPGCVTRNDTVLSLLKGSRPLLSGEHPDDPALKTKIFAVPDFLLGCTATDNAGRETEPLVGDHRIITEDVMAYKVLARYPNQGANQLIGEDHYVEARRRYDEYVSRYGLPDHSGLPTLGVDVAEGAEGGDFNAFVLYYEGLGPQKLRLAAPPVLHASLRTNDTAVRVCQLARLRGASRVYIDGIGLGVGVYSDCVSGCISSTGEVVAGLGRRMVVAVKTSQKPTKHLVGSDGKKKGEFNKLRDQLLWDVGDFLKSPRAALPPSDSLRDDLLALRWAVHEETGKIVVSPKKDLRERLGRSPDELDALKMNFAPVRLGKPAFSKLMHF